jgi:hypothetical protein
MTHANCPFCGVATTTRHETQQACIDALHSEIAQTRRILENVTESPPAGPDHEEREDKQLA